MTLWTSCAGNPQRRCHRFRPWLWNGQLQLATVKFILYTGNDGLQPGDLFRDSGNDWNLRCCKWKRSLKPPVALAQCGGFLLQVSTLCSHTILENGTCLRRDGLASKCKADGHSSSKVLDLQRCNGPAQCAVSQPQLPDQMLKRGDSDMFNTFAVVGGKMGRTVRVVKIPKSQSTLPQRESVLSRQPSPFMKEGGRGGTRARLAKGQNVAEVFRPSVPSGFSCLCANSSWKGQRDG